MRRHGYSRDGFHTVPDFSGTLIDDPGVVQKILRHLGAWHDPPTCQPNHCPPGSYTYEPCDDVDPMPDYENVLTD